MGGRVELPEPAGGRRKPAVLIQNSVAGHRRPVSTSCSSVTGSFCWGPEKVEQNRDLMEALSRHMSPWDSVCGSWGRRLQLF